MLLTTSVHFLVLIFLGMLSLVLVLIIVVLFNSFLQYKESVRISGWLKIINQKISEVIVYEDQELPSDQEFRKFSDNSSKVDKNHRKECEKSRAALLFFVV